MPGPVKNYLSKMSKVKSTPVLSHVQPHLGVGVGIRRSSFHVAGRLVGYRAQRMG